MTTPVFNTLEFTFVVSDITFSFLGAAHYHALAIPIPAM
jgi:hypothetical protein